MNLQGRADVIAVLVFVGYAEWSHCQPMLSSYKIELDDRLSLIHSTGDAFRVIDGSKEVLMIDPVWDNMKLDAYCRLSKALLIRAHKLDERKQPSDALASYFVIDAPDAKSAVSCTGPLSDAEFRERLLSLSASSGDVAWVIPTYPQTIERAILVIVTYTMLLVMMFGYILPIPFALILAHYVVLKKRLHRLTGNAEKTLPV